MNFYNVYYSQLIILILIYCNILQFYVPQVLSDHDPCAHLNRIYKLI